MKILFIVRLNLDISILNTSIEMNGKLQVKNFFLTVTYLKVIHSNTIAVSIIRAVFCVFEMAVHNLSPGRPQNGLLVDGRRFFHGFTTENKRILPA